MNPVALFEMMRGLYRWIRADPLPRITTLAAFPVNVWLPFQLTQMREIQAVIGINVLAIILIVAVFTMHYMVLRMSTSIVRRVESRYIHRLSSDTTMVATCRLLHADRIVFGQKKLEIAYDAL